nr:immunoglobulin heavy chain junction region [Mus musculus]
CAPHDSAWFAYW